ncbi:hypothetical protein SAMN05216167_11235 [Spirosoma endophyticum]|uniref:Uncharacterized protein n=1 Tax=Spirosoma endophyticum TaxID=662367 RepID=A0A1I1Z756_9BACT|nr:hypothetical protein SAMN05216167_11235 [Spirosoma endophyticum]
MWVQKTNLIRRYKTNTILKLIHSVSNYRNTHSSQGGGLGETDVSIWFRAGFRSTLHSNLILQSLDHLFNRNH